MQRPARSLPLLAALLLLLLLVVAGSAAPAAAHHGQELAGRIKSLDAAAMGDGTWTIEAVIVEAGSGRPFPGVNVRLEDRSAVVSPPKFVLEPTDVEGRYAATVSGAPGAVRFLVRVTPVAGAAEEIEPFQVERSVDLPAADDSVAAPADATADDGAGPGGATSGELVGETANATDASSDSDVGVVPLVAGGAALALAAAAAFAYRSRAHLATSDI